MDAPTLLFVCHANICRSPMAERLARLAGAPVWPVSAGTHATGGEPIHPASLRVLVELGADGAGFSSRALTADMVADAGLVLAATREQRAVCVRLAPSAVRRTFTIRQFGRLTGALDPAGVPRSTVDPRARLAAVLDLVADVRGTLQPVTGDEDDLADPVNGTEGDMRACARQIQVALGPAWTLIGAP